MSATQEKSLSTQSKNDFIKFVRETDGEQLCSMIVKIIHSSDVLKKLDSILQSFSESESCQRKRLKLVEAILVALKTSKVSGKHADNIINRIVVDFTRYDKASLQKLVNFCINSIRSNDDESTSWKDVMPILLEVLQGEKFISHRNKEISGLEYKASIIESICDSDWDPKILTSLAKMFGEISFDTMNNSICDNVMKTLCDKLGSVQANEIPPLVHQLLRLSPKQDNKNLFSTLSKYFAKRYARLHKSNSESAESCETISTEEVTLKELQDVESTVLYHISQSAQVNQKSLMDFIKSLKSACNAPQFILDPFTLSVLLLVSNTFKEEVFKILKTAVVRQLQDDENRENSAWIRNVLPDSPDVVESIKQVIENSNKDLLILKSLVDFAFVLLSHEIKGKDDKHLLWDIGCKIIQRVIRKRHEAGATVLENLTNKISGGGTNITQYTVCLAYMCQKMTKIVLDYQVWITSLLDQLLTIPGSAATQVLQAVLPLLCISGSLRESLVLILRKGLYRKGTQNRQMAVLGFLQLLKHMKLSSLRVLSQSQSSLSTVASNCSLLTQATLERSAYSNPEQSAGLCQEVLNILSRCFTHESQVRMQLYRGLSDAVRKNGELSEYAINLLLGQFSLFYVSDENIILPLLFDKCTTIQGADVVLLEPLGDLVFSMQKMYVTAAASDTDTVENCAMVLESLCKRMTQCELDNLQIDECTDLTDPIPKCQQKLHNVKLMISVYEALMAFRVEAWSINSDNVAQNVTALFKGYTRFADYLKKANKQKKDNKKKDKDAADSTFKRPGRVAVAKLPPTIMDLETICRFVTVLYEKSENIPWSTKEQASHLKSRIEIHRYVLQCCLQIVQGLKAAKDDEMKSTREKNERHCVLIAALLYKHVISDMENVRTFDQNTAVLGLECFKEICDLLCSTHTSQLPKLLEKTGRADSSDRLSVQICNLIEPLRDLLRSSLEEEENEEAVAGKIPLLLIDTISKLINKIVFEDLNANDKPFEFLKDIAKNCESVDPQVTLMIIQLILTVEEKSEDYGESIDDLCEDFCAEFEVLDTRAVQEKTFKIIHEKTVQQSYILVNKMLTNKMQSIQWLLGRLSAEHSMSVVSGVEDLEARKNTKTKEKKMCEQFSKILQHLEMLTIAKIMPGPCSEAIFRNLQKAYILGSSIAKYFHKRSTPTFTAFEGTKFKQTVELAGKSVKLAVKELIAHIESSQDVGKSKDVNVRRNKVLKEVMIIPLVAQAEDAFDTDVCLLGKKTKTDFSMHIKSDPIRDFRLKDKKIVENMEAMNASMLQTQATQRNAARAADQTNDSDTDATSSPPRRKQSRRADSSRDSSRSANDTRDSDSETSPSVSSKRRRTSLDSSTLSN